MKANLQQEYPSGIPSVEFRQFKMVLHQLSGVSFVSSTKTVNGGKQLGLDIKTNRLEIAIAIKLFGSLN